MRWLEIPMDEDLPRVGEVFPNLEFSPPDDNGVIYLLDSDGNKSDTGLQTFDPKRVEILQLLGESITYEEAERIVDQRIRQRKLDKLLDNESRKG